VYRMFKQKREKYEKSEGEVVESFPWI
jgi:hypothetical protein